MSTSNGKEYIRGSDVQYIAGVRLIRYAGIGLMITGAINILLAGFTVCLPQLLQVFWKGPQTPQALSIFVWYIPIGIGLFVCGFLNVYAIIGLKKLRKQAGLIGMASCIMCGIFFILPIQPLMDLAASIINIGTAVLLGSGWSVLRSSEE